MSYESHTGYTTFADQEQAPPFLDPAEASHRVMFAAAMHITNRDLDSDPHGRLGMRTTQSGNPALFHVGQIVFFDRGDLQTRRFYMAPDGFLHTLEQDEHGQYPQEVQQRLNWLEEVQDWMAKEEASRARGDVVGEFVGLRDEPIVSPINRILRGIAHFGLGSRQPRGRHAPQTGHAPNASTRPPRGPQASTGSGRHRASGKSPRTHSSTSGRHRAK